MWGKIPTVRHGLHGLLAASSAALRFSNQKIEAYGSLSG